jgi:endo-1,4-beta-xylanase
MLDRFARYKLPLQVTEFDVSIDDEELQADYLRDFFLACFSHPSVELLQQWGFWERVHWRPKAALFRADWSAKPNGRQFLDLVHNRWKTKCTGTTDAGGRFSVHGFLGDYEVTVEKDGRVQCQTFRLPKAGHRVRLVLTPGPKS